MAMLGATQHLQPVLIARPLWESWRTGCRGLCSHTPDFTYLANDYAVFKVQQELNQVPSYIHQDIGRQKAKSN